MERHSVKIDGVEEIHSSITSKLSNNEAIGVFGCFVALNSSHDTGADIFWKSYNVVKTYQVARIVVFPVPAILPKPDNGISAQIKADPIEIVSFIMSIFQKIYWKRGNWAFSCDFHENDLSNAKMGQIECRGACASTKGCTHFTWNALHGGTCWMKKGEATKESAVFIKDETSVCGIVFPLNKNQGIDWKGGNWAYACDFSGNDLSNKKIGHVECRRTCASTHECTHYTWTAQNEGTCWMKKGETAKGNAVKVSNKNYICGIVEDLNENQGIDWVGGTWAFACDFHGNDMKYKKTRQAECRGACASTPGCTHFAWNSDNGGTCWMKKGGASIEEAFKVEDKTTVCGIVDAANLYPGIDWKKGNRAYACDFYGNDLHNFRIGEEIYCSILCIVKQECTHFTWTSHNEGTCWMKKGGASKEDAFRTSDKKSSCGIVRAINQ